MKFTVRSILIATALVGAFLAVFQVPVWQGDARRRSNRAKVHRTIYVGQHLDDAQEELRSAGFRLAYDEPIGASEGHLHQLVVIGNTQPNGFETFAYVTGWKWVPFTHRESAYVGIDADLDGKIVDID